MTENVLLLNASLTNPNQGVNALTIGTLTALSQRFPCDLTVVMMGRQDCYHDVCVGSSGVVRVQEVGVRRRRMLSLLTTALIHGGWWSISGDRSAPSWLSEYIANANHVIDLSAGDSFTDLYGLVRLVYQSLPRLAAIMYGKQLVFFPQTYGPFSTALGRSLATWLFKHSRFVFTREHYSTAAMQAYVPAEKLVELSDMAFLMASQPANDLPEIAYESGFVGVNVSGLLFHADDNPKYGWDSALYRSFTKEVIIRFVRNLGRSVVLIPHVYAPGDRTDDIAASEMLYAMLPQDVQAKVQMVRERLWAPQIKDLIGRSDFFLGARMHACIAAASLGVPVVPVSYSHKFQGVFGQLGLEDLVCSPEHMQQDDMLARVDHVYRNSVRVRAKLVEATSQAQIRALAAVEYL